ncbi:hypothetical protein [Leptolyngbya sp. NM2-A1]
MMQFTTSFIQITKSKLSYAAAIVSLISCAISPVNAQVTEGVINGDNLVTINGIPWAADGWRFSKVLEIQRDSIDSTVVGRVVLDRHGEDSQPILGIRSPFAAPRPGRAVLVSAWSSNNDGCSVELILQIATTPDQVNNVNLITPTRLDMMINGQRITLNAVEDAPGVVDRSASFPYVYSTTVNNQNNERVSVNLPGVWVMARHLFVIDADVARALSNAPAQDIPIRITLRNLSPVTIPIGENTVERWSRVYSYNPSCTPVSS